MKRFLDFGDAVIRFIGRPGQDPPAGAFFIDFVEGRLPGSHLAGLVAGPWRTDLKFVYTGAISRGLLWIVREGHQKRSKFFAILARRRSRGQNMAIPFATMKTDSAGGSPGR